MFGTAIGVECIIRNMSEAGACLEVQSPFGIPNSFILLIRPEIIKRSCEVAWRNGNRMGVRFHSHPTWRPI
jgi:hypothetical protein